MKYARDGSLGMGMSLEVLECSIVESEAGVEGGRVGGGMRGHG